MKVRLTKPLPQPQFGRVIPAGVILEDAPEELMKKLVRQERAEWVFPRAEDRSVTPPDADPLPDIKQTDSVQRIRTRRRRKVEE